MKKFPAIIAVFAILSSVIVLSCTREFPQPPERDIMTLLTQSVWRIEQTYSIQNNTVFFYKRGGQNNTFNYDSDFLEFERDGTGTYTAGNNSYVIDWTFDNSAKTEISYTIHDYANGQPAQGEELDVKLENVVVTFNSFRYAEIYTNIGGTHSVGSTYREPITQFDR